MMDIEEYSNEEIYEALGEEANEFIALKEELSKGKNKFTSAKQHQMLKLTAKLGVWEKNRDQKNLIKNIEENDKNVEKQTFEKEKPIIIEGSVKNLDLKKESKNLESKVSRVSKAGKNDSKIESNIKAKNKHEKERSLWVRDTLHKELKKVAMLFDVDLKSLTELCVSEFMQNHESEIKEKLKEFSEL